MGEFGIIGDDNFGTDLPITTVDTEDLVEEKKAAKFSRTREFKKLKEHLESRIAFYQQSLPDGRPITGDIKPEDWVIANAIIAEFKAVLNAYEMANEAVKDLNERRQ